MSDVRKFQHLIAYLRGEPLNLIKAIPITEANYAIAFQVLTERYQNERLLATTYWNALNNAPTLKNNCSARDLRYILDTFRENIDALDLLELPTGHWKFPLFNMLLGRLNTSIRTAFEIEHSKIKFPSYQNLTEFLNNHCRALESVQITPNTSYSQNLQQTSNSHPNFRKQQNYNQYQKHPTQSYVSNIDQNKQSSQNTRFIKNKSHSFNSYSTPNSQIAPTHNSNRPNANSQRNFNSPIQYKCRLCNQNSHSNLAQCHMFIAKNINDRIAYVKQNNVCLNCLRFSHTENSCQSNFACRLCGERHHTTLHISQGNEVISQNSYLTNVSHSVNQSSIPDNTATSSSKIPFQTPQMSQIKQSSVPHIPIVASVNSSQPPISSNSQNAQNSSTLTSYESSNDQFLSCGCTSIKPSKPQTTVLLSTTKVDILDARGYYQTVRVVLDNASQANFISENCLNRLGLSRKKLIVPIVGINQSSPMTNGITNCTIKPLNKANPIFTFELFVLPKVCAEMPSIQVNTQNWHHISNLELADDKFNIPAPVDILLGAHAYSQIIKPGIVQGQPGQPIAMETVFGWVLLGNAQTFDKQITSPSISCHLTSLSTPSLDQSIRKFWEIESLPSKQFVSQEEEKCEAFYRRTVTRDESGRFQVSLPFRHSRPDLGDTYAKAHKCFLSLESKLLKNPDLYVQYADVMNNYIKNDYMSLVPQPRTDSRAVNYLPHHCVVRPEKASTKVRIVFNASAQGSKGISLNSTLLSGPKLQANINTILLKFRFHFIVLLSDISQMFLQIRVSPEDRDYQRLLWRFSHADAIQEYRFNTVTFGVTSSPYLAIRTIKELAKLEKQKYPEASRVLLEDIFVDDICAGADSIESALALQKDLIALLKSGCFELKKWASNDARLLTNLSQDECQIPMSLDKENSIALKVLGLQWDPKSDTLFFSYSVSDKPCTKRNILSNIASIFDPLGLITPISFLTKCIMQKLWILKVGWDDPVPKPISDLWTQFQMELPLLSKISFPRYIFSRDILRCQLHAFSDASEAGYAACVYVRLELPNDVIKTSLVIGKSRVSPLKTLSLPRLELLGSALMSDLVNFVITTYSSLITIDEVFAYTDSQVVLYWVSSSPHRWKTFVANRVSHIQENLPENVHWYHVKSQENPADVASRGINPAQFINHPLWFTGPPWLNSPYSTWNLQNPCMEKCDQGVTDIISREEKHITLTANVELHFIDFLLYKFSSLHYIQKIICHSRRIFYNFKHRDSPLTGSITIFELQHSLLILVKRCQEIHFSTLISQIKNNELLPKPLRKLAPFLDKNGFIRVGGRLRHTDAIPFEAKHPLLLPRADRFTQLLIEHIHKENMHPGLNTIQHLLRQQFWILSSRRAIQSVLSRCIRCFRLRPKAYVPYQGDLPPFRISQLKCFSHATLDYAGPIKILPGRWYRGTKELKAYICIFCCTSTRAIHIEVASDLTSDCFIAAFRRFVARRGRCNYLYSDNGTNFVGANNQLKELSKYATDHLKIKWHFFPSSSPHFNGLSEAGVKSVKTHLYRVIGEQKLTYEELNTLVVQIEALLNSRPISAQSSDPNDLLPLTPGHFLTMEPLNSCLDPDLSHLKLNTLSRWQLVQRLNSDFWKRWKDEYLNTLQQRSKWTKTPSRIMLNTLVVIQNENTSPLQWSLGRIVELHPGSDGHVRVVTVRTQQGLFKRPVVKLCPLPLY
nr:unnamed protein product [Callosobruchus analis]